MSTIVTAEQRRAKLVRVIDEQGVGAVAKYLSDYAGVLLEVARERGPAQLLELVDAARLADEVLRTRAKRAGADIEQIRRAERALQTFALEASATLGEVFAELKPGSGTKKGKRAEVGEEMGLSRQEVHRLMKLAKVEPQQREQAIEQLSQEERPLTPRGVLRVVSSPSASAEHQSAEWYTPPELLRAFEAGHGVPCFDEDLCSNIVAQSKNVGARRWYCLVGTYWVGKGDRRREVEFLPPTDEGEQQRALAAGATKAQVKKALKSWGGPGGVTGEGDERRLSQEPSGVVFGQPDYADPAPTIRTILDGYNEGRGRIKGATVLLNTATSSEAQQRLLRACSAVLFIGKGADHARTRLAFEQSDGKAKAGNDRDQIAVYLGPAPQRWAAALAGWGTVIIIAEALHDPPKPKKAPPKASARKKAAAS